MNTNEFVQYCLSFYAPGQIYDIGATEKEVLYAMADRMRMNPYLPFDGDSIDREIVRDIMIRNRK